MSDEIEKKKYNEMQTLVNMLNDWTKEYDKGTPVVTDKEWDDKYFALAQLEKEIGYTLPNSPTQAINYEVVNNLQKVKHNHFMSSLAKTKDWNEFLQYFSEKNVSKDVIGMPKLDGLTCSIRYLDGKLVSAETRGNGEIGEDIFHNAKVLPSIPKRINYIDELIIDGEIICDVETFNQKFADNYANPRNFAAGSIRLLDSKECYNRHLTFVAWNIVKGFEDTNSFLKRLVQLDELGFVVVPWTSSFDYDAKEFLIDQSKKLGYPIDGLVGRFDDIAFGQSLGSTGHHSKAAYAFKFYDETYDTYLRNIEWTMGRTGILTPVAVFDPVEADGSTIERASMHNISIMDELLGKHPHEGQPIKVFKANMIIPQIYSAEKSEEFSGREFSLIQTCPICGKFSTKVVESDSGVLNMYCTNPDCDGKLINKLDHFCNKHGLDIKGLSTATLEKLIDLGWLTCYEDIYKLYEYQEDWEKLPGFGEKSVSNILEAIKKSQNCSLESFITAIGIPLIGRNISKELCKYIDSYEDFRNKVDEKFDFSALDGFGDVKSENILKFDYTEADKVFDYLNIIKSDDNQEKTLNNITVVITGKLSHFKNRDELKKVIEDMGGKVTGSVSGNTTYLINNNSTSTTDKNLTAKKLGIPILTEDDFIQKFLTNEKNSAII